MKRLVRIFGSYTFLFGFAGFTIVMIAELFVTGDNVSSKGIYMLTTSIGIMLGGIGLIRLSDL